MNTLLKVLLVLALLPFAACGASCACVGVAGAIKKVSAP